MFTGRHMQRKRLAALLACAMTLAACAADPGDAPAGDPAAHEDLPLGDVNSSAADGFYGAATTCKDIPPVDPLADPAIVVSLDGLTLHLYDRAGTYDRVFPIGPGKIENGKSLTPVSTQFATGTFHTRTDEPPTFDGPTPDQAKWGWNQQCRIWWTSAETGRQVPVFAGLPFIRLAGNPLGAGYGIHGPVDNYTMPNGGQLRRSYVSHGCIRMQAADIVEVWGRIQGRQAPVRVQKAVERRADGTAVDYDPWLLSDCSSDADCAFDGGFCHSNPYTGRGFCTRSCTHACPDRAGHPTSFCIDDPDGSGGICTLKSTTATNHCRSLPGFAAVSNVSRPDGSASADVCAPGSHGWIGDRCVSDSECDTGLCTPVAGGPQGICTQRCTRYCPDKDGGYATTFCIDAPDRVPDTGGLCVARCSSDDDCPADTKCVSTPRHNQPGVVVTTCVPQ